MIFFSISILTFGYLTSHSPSYRTTTHHTTYHMHFFFFTLTLCILSLHPLSWLVVTNFYFSLFLWFCFLIPSWNFLRAFSRNGLFFYSLVSYSPFCGCYNSSIELAIHYIHFSSLFVCFFYLFFCFLSTFCLFAHSICLICVCGSEKKNDFFYHHVPRNANIINKFIFK